jgi:hypothetical protein
MPRLVIHKEGENPTIESPTLSADECNRQATLLNDAMERIALHRTDPEHSEGKHISAVIDLGWVQIADHIVRGIEGVADEQVAA